MGSEGTRNAESLARRLIQATRAARIAIWDWDARTNTLHWSPVFLDILGIDESEFNGQLSDFTDRLVPEDRDRVTAALRAYLEAGTPYEIEYEMFRGDGRRISISEKGQATVDEAGRTTGLSGTVQDITDRRTLEKRLLAAERIGQIGHWLLDLRENRLTWSPEVFRIHGLDPDDPQPGLQQALDFFHPDDLPQVLASLDSVVTEGTVRALDARLRLPSGEIRHVHLDGVATIGEDGNPTELFGIIHNRTEAARREEQLAHAQRMEAIGHLVGGVAHDFNNLLAVIQGNLELLHEDEDRRLLPRGERLDILTSAISATRRGAELTRSLLAFARKSHLEPQLVDINDIVRETDGWLSRAMPASIRMSTRLTDASVIVRLDPAGLQSALLNVIVNARDAMPDGGTMTIETAVRHVSEAEIGTEREQLETGHYVMLSVSDTGSGISPELLPRVFEPFVTGKRIGEGSGLGLSMVQGFVRQSGGFVHIHSETGVGTCVRLYFPETETRDRPAEGPDAQVQPAAQVRTMPTARILVAEDQLDVLSVIVRTLTRAGYQIDAATTGDEALRRFREGGRFDLLLTDVVMPGTLSGPKLAKACRTLQPGLPVIFMSGYASEATIHGNGLHPTDVRLTKPVPRSELLDTIRACLSGGDDGG
ncbi:hybrid sensor histidine kinase/response regulator [Thetidibacter halocola]|uniref:histidine kinase n=1 Tax=Thetidibacter halocola TaxID=2827239 RepID=A0A8J7WEG8_9RHOB|nr:PAS domain-containing hybrid sensor histidine kinase/response regulator [Thetidibacter halocola]MBS0124889.1 PAS domain-containing protein [Thetidibacter halocola]